MELPNARQLSIWMLMLAIAIMFITIDMVIACKGNGEPCSTDSDCCSHICDTRFPPHACIEFSNKDY
ncbi:hypothetical protein DERP_010423 [Dermatophagoides pteronyssinus]|uniref:Uncharacterized protein n=1 Tax=Dermatophagoides pteronyssinus TaxID=6956 RepID=A0ABQ8J503_DERPT|nr:hypothetical protein DERP_010423 [Dermatophagoides pteronyssinus]